ncbi:putative transposable element [Trichonephila clavipes]|nr:putative transposable element [Trichonephila clavipes]
MKCASNKNMEYVVFQFAWHQSFLVILCPALLMKFVPTSQWHHDFSPPNYRLFITIYIVSIHVSDEAHFWLNGYVNKQNCRIWSETNPQVYVETPLHPEKLTVWCALWAGGILLQKR